MQNPANLMVYRRAVEFSARIHTFAPRISKTRAPGLSGQLLRAASSIPANIAEGAGHPDPGRCRFHLGVALGSAFEVETHLRLAQRLFPTIADFMYLLDELDQIRRMTYALREYRLNQLNTKKGKGP